MRVLKGTKSVLLADILKYLFAVFVFPIMFLLAVQVVTFEKVLTLENYLHWAGFMVITFTIITPMIKSQKIKLPIKIILLLLILLVVPTKNSIFPLSFIKIFNKLFEYFVVVFYCLAVNFNDFINKPIKKNKYTFYK